MRQKIISILFMVLMVVLTSSHRETLAASPSSFQPSLTWEKIDTSSMPSPRYGFSMTLNEANQVEMFFGGFVYATSKLSNDLWLSDGHQWLEFPTPHRPLPRTYGSLAYDSGRQEAVLFGGSSNISYLDDTWIFNGIDWIERSTQSAPSPRANASIVYDPDHQRTYLFGGTYSYEGDYRKYNDTWSWDGFNWQPFALDNRPSIRDGAAIAYDPVHHNVLLYGGFSIAAPLNDTWIWNGQVWTEQQPANNPTMGDIEYPQMVFDNNRQQVVMVGVHWDYNNSHTETWAWDGQDWAELPVFNPLPRELLGNGKLVYLPGMQTLAIVNTFLQKVLNPDNTISLVERSEVWALVNRHMSFFPVMSR